MVLESSVRMLIFYESRSSRLGKQTQINLRLIPSPHLCDQAKISKFQETFGNKLTLILNKCINK